MLERFRLWLARKLYPEVFERVYLSESVHKDYMRWLSEMPDITLTLENMKHEIDGHSLSLMYPASNEGPWEISRLREHLRVMRREGLVVPNYPAYIPERRQQ